MKQIVVGALLAASVGVVAAGERVTGFDPATLKGPKHGTPNEVLVLGTPHLAHLPASFEPASLKPLMARLQQWRPAIIAVEASSGPLCAFMRQYPARYQEAIDNYCWDPAPARAATGLDVPAATAEAERLLANWPAAPTPAQRRRLAALFLAAGEPVSAMVQWLRLPQAERRAGDGLDGALVAFLDKPRRNELYSLAAPLAARLGLERVVPMDDQATNIPVGDDKAYGEALAKAWDNPATAQRRQAGEALQGQLGAPDGVMAMYRAYNHPAQARLAFDSDFGAALQSGAYGRHYVGYWETRNLRMAANIREAIAARPGSRTLVLVGASHKWYLDHYLNQMHDVRIADTDAVLK